jgi:2-polyprenyl-6-methoxyphenol hydroxylase-like FAD-dependent oxidoreductase
VAIPSKALIVGGSVGGMACAISLRRSGLQVDLAEIDPGWKIYGAGITMTGPTLRALQILGVLEEVKHEGATWEGISHFTRAGHLIAELPTPPIEPGLPGRGGIMRPALHRILSASTREEGVHVRLGTTLETLTQVPGGVEVKLTDGHRDRYDLVIGADGIYSKMRERIFPDAPKPRFTGQAIYRFMADRPREVERTQFYMDEDATLGLSPVSETHIYVFLLESQAANHWIPLEEQPRRLYQSLEGWGGVVPQVRANVMSSAATTINYRPLESILLPKPWYSGRVLLIGDAAHATTPHLASGAGMAIEDGIVLAQELESGDLKSRDLKSGGVEAALARFMERRYERGRLAVENSVKLGEIEMNHGSPQDRGRLLAESMRALQQPM